MNKKESDLNLQETVNIRRKRDIKRQRQNESEKEDLEKVYYDRQKRAKRYTERNKSYRTYLD